MDTYSAFARYYDLENSALTEDIPFWLELAREQGGPVLELGCGTGRIALQLARDGWMVTGVDSSPEMLARAKTKLALHPKIESRIRWIEADFTRLDLGATFPLIIAPFNTLTHLLDDSQVDGLLSSVRRHLTAGGIFVFDLPNPALVYGDLPQGMVLERTFSDEERSVTIQQFSCLRVDRLAQLGHITWMYDETDADGKLSRTTIPLTVRYFFPAQLKLMMNNANLPVAHLWGDFDRSPLQEESPHLIAVCRP